jgi:4-hydroxybenzoyl-CoA thioesterase
MSFSFTRRLTIEWGHCDPAGIVFNPRFFEFFDWSTALLVASAAGMGKAEMLMAHNSAGIPLVETNAVFHRPARYGDEVEIGSTVVAVGRSSFEIEHRLLNAGELAVAGREKRVWTVHDAESGKLRSAPIPDSIARKLRGVS